MAGEFILGIDAGTTSVKAGVISNTGSAIVNFSQSYSTQRNEQAFVEQDPDDWIRLIYRAMETFEAKGFLENVGSVGLTSQVNTHVFVGAEGKPLMPAILWQDGRASAEAAELDARVSDAQKIAWWGAPMPIDASHALPRMLWVARHRPEIWEKTRWVMLPKDYCIFKLTGEVSTDPVSNIGLVDNNLSYIPQVLDLVPGAADRMAPLVPVTEIAGQLKDGMALTGCPVVSGTMDAWAGLVGTGGARENSSVYLSGTSEILGISSTNVIPTPGVIVFPECNGVRMHAAPTQSGGDAKLWFSEVSGLSMGDMSELVSHTPRSAATPLFLPQLEGERAPLWDADLRAVFLGMSRRTGMGDMARAVYEGVAFSARFALETLQMSAATRSDYITCGGGGFGSESWNQIRADVLGVDLHTLQIKEPGVLGAATIAAIGSGTHSNFADAYGSLAKCDRIFTPNAEAHQKCTEIFVVYKEAITANTILNKRLSEIGNS